MHVLRAFCVQVRLSTAVWLWALQFVALLLVSVGQKVEGTGGSYSSAVAHLCLLCCTACLLILGLAVEVCTKISGRTKRNFAMFSASLLATLDLKS